MANMGWSLPPGVSMRDIDPPEQPCEVCGKMPDDCICPECTVCGQVGNPSCYAGNPQQTHENHGLVRTMEQIESLQKADDKAAAACKAEAEYWEKMPPPEED